MPIEPARKGGKWQNGVAGEALMQSEGLACSDFRQIVHELLDGNDLSQKLRRQVRQHREHCEPCTSMHNLLLQLAAVCEQVSPPAEFDSADQEALLQRIHAAVVQSMPELNGVGEEGQPLFQLSDADLDEIFGRCMVRRTYQRLKTVRELGRLDQTKIDSEIEPGNITSLERFLLTREELESLSALLAAPKQSDAIKVVMASDGDALTRLHDYINANPGVVLSIVISADGTILSSRHSEDADIESVAVWSLAAYHNARAACNAFGYNAMQQLVSRSDKGYTVLSQVLGLIVITFVNGGEREMMHVLKQIHKIS